MQPADPAAANLLAPRPAAAGGPGLGELLRLAVPLARLFLPEQPNPLLELQVRRAALELQALTRGATAIAFVPWEAIVAPWARSDWIIIGRRGGGKTATAAAIAQAAMAQTGQPTYALGWPAEHAAALGFTPAPRSLERLRDCVVVADEAGLTWSARKTSRVLLRGLALARHNNVSWIWTAQNASTLSKEVWRFEARTVWKGLDALAARFDREELADLTASILALQTCYPELQGVSAAVCCAGSAYYGTQVPLPAGWTEEVSTLWRGGSMREVR